MGRAMAKCSWRSRRRACVATDEFTRSGADPEGLFPAIFGHEGAGIVVDVGPWRDHARRRATTSFRCTRRNVGNASPAWPQKTNLCTAIRATQGKGVMPDGTSRFSIGKDPVHHYMGCSTFSNSHGDAGDRAREDSRRTLPSTRSATSAAASPPASARSSTPRRSSRAPTWSCSAWAASA